MMTPCLAYIGPGAGFAFLGSFLILLTAIGLVILSVLSWPCRALAALLFRRKRAKSAVRRVVVVGLDGFDPGQYRRLAAAGRLPNLKRLEKQGSFSELQSSCPSISPVAWSCFVTGANPGKHNIFDFLSRDPQTYLPELSSVRITATARGRPEIQRLRKSLPFWNVLGEHGVFSTILRVPITFPPERFRGLLLSGMCIPDLRGSQGSFTFYSTGTPAPEETTGGLRIRVTRESDVIRADLPGPSIRENLELKAPLRIQISGNEATLQVSGQRVPLRIGEYTPWVRIVFRAGPFSKISGLCRFVLKSVDPDFQLYVTPIHIDPERPAFPISHPSFYSIYLAKLLGPFATLGLAEDTWALNERVLSEKDFLEQVYSIHREREAMFFQSLKRTRRGLCVCVFDASDRIQHMFRGSPAVASAKAGQNDTAALDEMYEKMDAMVGRVMAQMKKKDVLMVISDHGFTDFRRGVNLNAWLRDNGYLTLKPDASGRPYLADVDWDKTRAYTFGLSGIYLNRKGREAKGIVADDKALQLKAELTSRLKGLADGDRKPIRSVYDGDQVYRGPYAANGPDLVIGYDHGYRASWDAAVGKTAGPVLSDNPKHWSADHCVDYKLVPGVFFSNRKLRFEEAPALVDIGPTILGLFGVARPGYMDGRVWEMGNG